MAQPRDFGFSEEVGLLKDAAHRFFEEKQPLVKLRPHLAGTEDPYHGATRAPWFDADDWREMVELGWTMIPVPESAGGLDMGLVAAVAIQEEVGRAACPTPLSSTLKAAFVLRAAGANALLEQVAGGRSLALALQGPHGDLEAFATSVTVTDGRLSGSSHFVQDAGKVDGFIVAARSDAGLGLYHVARDAVTLEADRIVDLTRDQGRIVLDGVPADEVVPPGKADEVLARSLPAVWTLVAADIAGAAEWQLQTTAEYAKVRVQFDRPIGFFQAVKHPIVDMMITTDETRSLVYNAACAFDHDPEDAARCAHLAKASAADTAAFCSNRSTQLHGGIGFTWESDVQIYHKRQLHSRYLFGDGPWHRAQVAELL